MPEPGPFGETRLEASVRAIVVALFVNNPAGGWVESVFTRATHLFFFFLFSGMIPLVQIQTATMPGSNEFKMS